MSFRKPQYCMAYIVLAVSFVGGIYIICRDYLAFVFLWERITVLPFRYFFMMAFLFLCAFICMGVAFFSSILPHNQISRRVLWCCVLVLQCAGMLLVQAWKWPLPVLAGALFIIQYLSCYLVGLIQRDIQDEKLDDKFLYVFPQFWIQVPLTAVGWFFMSGYY
ncbi:hypothetical protein ACRV8U_003123 [Escherichia coli]|nr:hypothetical protein [Salmonella enterica]EIZ8195580.1 hypothetical protein [Salmonella enterica]